MGRKARRRRSMEDYRKMCEWQARTPTDDSPRPDTLHKMPTRCLCPSSNPVSGSPAISWATLENISPFCLNPETKQAALSHSGISQNRQRSGANPSANSAPEISFFCFSVQTYSDRCWNTSACASKKRELCSHRDIFI